MKTLRILALTLIVVSAVACGGGGPAGVARDWLKAAAVADGTTTLKLTCQDYRDQVQTMGFLAAGLGLLVGIDTQNAEVDISDLKFTTTSESGDQAVVHVEGEMIIGLLGAAMPQYYDADLLMVKEGGSWKVCGER
jgi:hypothetical protein